MMRIAWSRNRAFSCGRLQNRLQIRKRVRLGGGFVRAPAQNAWKTQSDAGLVSTGGGNAFVRELEHLRRLDRAHRAEFFHGMRTDPTIELFDFRIAQT